MRVSRRAVQGYEKAGLVRPSGKNAMGHLLYDEEAQERIGLIRLYQGFGFQIKEIAGMLELSEQELVGRLEKRKRGLANRLEEINGAISEINKIIEELK